MTMTSSSLKHSYTQMTACSLTCSAHFGRGFVPHCLLGPQADVGSAFLGLDWSTAFSATMAGRELRECLICSAHTWFLQVQPGRLSLHCRQLGGAVSSESGEGKSVDTGER